MTYYIIPAVALLSDLCLNIKGQDLEKERDGELSVCPSGRRRRY